MMITTDKKKSIETRKIRYPRPIAWFFDLVFSPKMLRLYLFGLACLVTLIIAFYTIENIRGSLAWSSHVEELKADGISTDYRDYIPPEIPDEENLAKIPMFVAFEYDREPFEKSRFPWEKGTAVWKDETWGPLKNLDYVQKSAEGKRLDYGIRNALGNWLSSVPTDLDLWQIYYRGTNAVRLKLNDSRHTKLLEDPK